MVWNEEEEKKQQELHKQIDLVGGKTISNQVCKRVKCKRHNTTERVHDSTL